MMNVPRLQMMSCADGRGAGYPYELPPCVHPCGTPLPAPPCRNRCTNGTREWTADKRFATSVYSVADFQQELMKFGPFEVSFAVYSDFPTYKSGADCPKKHTILMSLRVSDVRDVCTVRCVSAQVEQHHWIVSSSCGVVSVGRHMRTHGRGNARHRPMSCRMCAQPCSEGPLMLHFTTLANY